MAEVLAVRAEYRLQQWRRIYEERLANGKFQRPRSEEERRLLDHQSFRWLMEGVKVEQKTAARKEN